MAEGAYYEVNSYNIQHNPVYPSRTGKYLKQGRLILELKLEVGKGATTDYFFRLNLKTRRT